MANEGLSSNRRTFKFAAFLLSSGTHSDICMAQSLLDQFGLKGKLILADKGYDNDKFVC
jgi:hypothetical protein